jgi:hypothetical protein
MALALAGATLSLALAAPAFAAQQKIGAEKDKAVSLSADGPAAGASKKKKDKAKTFTAPVGYASGTPASATANCTGKTHLTGGGFAVAPGLSGVTGLRTLTMTNFPSAPKSWTATSFSYTFPAASGTLTTYARCETSGLGKIAGVLTGTLSLPHSTGGDLVLNCAPGTHAIGGGFVGDPPNSSTVVSNNAVGFRIIVLQSRRTGPTQWTISGFNRADTTAGAPVPPTSNLTGYAICEKDGKGKSISEVSALVGIAENSRAAADASCSGKKHVVSGGFHVTPSTFPGTVPVVGIDETAPVGKKGWHTGLYEEPAMFAAPAGSALQTFAYCKKDPKKAKKK